MSVPCETCRRDTDNDGTRRCDACWEVEHRLRDYLVLGGSNAREFVYAEFERANAAAMDANAKQRAALARGEL